MNAPFFLNLDVIDTNTPGIYYPFTYELPSAVSLNQQGMYTTKVYVLPDDTVRLIGVANAPGGYIVEWLYPAQNPVFWMSVDDGEWSVIETDSNGLFKNKYGSVVKDDDEIGAIAFFLETKRNIPPGHVYRFQVQYDGNRFSDVLMMDLTNMKEIKTSNEVGGDRDGGDRGEAELPDAPSSASKGTSKKKNKVTPNEGMTILVPTVTSTPALGGAPGIVSPEIDMPVPASIFVPDGEIQAELSGNKSITPEATGNSADGHKKAAIAPSDTDSSLPATDLLPVIVPLAESKQAAPPPAADSSFAASSEDVDLPLDANHMIPILLAGVICFIVAIISYTFRRKRR